MFWVYTRELLPRSPFSSIHTGEITKGLDPFCRFLRFGPFWGRPPHFKSHFTSIHIGQTWFATKTSKVSISPVSNMGKAKGLDPKVWACPVSILVKAKGLDPKVFISPVSILVKAKGLDPKVWACPISILVKPKRSRWDGCCEPFLLRAIFLN